MTAPTDLRVGAWDLTLSPDVGRDVTFTLTDSEGEPVEVGALAVVLGGATTDVTEGMDPLADDLIAFAGVESDPGVWLVEGVTAPATPRGVHRLRLVVDGEPWTVGVASMSTRGTESPTAEVAR